jgi:hypothetical protein
MRYFFIFRLLFLLFVFISLVPFLIHITKPSKIPPLIPPHEVELLLEELFHPSTTLINVQFSWNKLIVIWRNILLKFVRDACHLCHNSVYLQCYQSIDINQYFHYINQSFYPFTEDDRPLGMGLYYDFDLKLMRSLNNSILPNDVTPCDYFHMFQLMIYVQIVLHEKKIDYFMTKGTFIGSLRHHDVIPWDTDIDLFIPYSAVPRFKNSFQQLNRFRNTYHITTTNENDQIHK